MRHFRRLRMAAFSLAFSALALASGIVYANDDSAHASKGLSSAARLASASHLGAGPMESFSGQFHIIYGDAPAGSGVPATSGYVLIDDQDQAIELLFDDQSLRAIGGARAINHRRVAVTGQAAVVPVAGVQVALPLLAVQALEHDEQKLTTAAVAAAQGVSGPQAWATILCRFADSAGVTPHPVSWFNALMLGTSAPGLEHYWRELSFNNVNLTGSAVYGWYTLPYPRSYYVYGSPAQLDHQRAANDCTAVADADAYFPGFVGINLMFNADLDGYAWGGSWTLTRDGQTKNYRMTWLPPWGYENQGPVGHEMGHGFGLPHSSGPYSATYDSRWDVMSDIWGNCPPYDPTYGCVGPHTISYHKDILGWIPSAQKYVAGPDTSQTITLERLGQPTSGTSYLMAQIPIGGSTTQFYTVEVRRFAGYDEKLPGEAVVIHRVDTTSSDRDAKVIDPDGNGNPDDAGAMWVTDETFVDSANGITVSVISSTATSSQVSIQVGAGGVPTATTGAATNVTASSATPNGTVNPNGLATTASFQWGTTTAYGNTTASQSLGSGTSAVGVSANLTGLTANTTYHYRVVATNSAGIRYGSNVSFTTASAPAITTPTPGTTLTSTTVTFTGGHTSADLQHYLYVGTSLGASNLVSRDLSTGHATSVAGLPTSGTIYVRYRTRFTSGWRFTDQQYTMSVK